VLPIPRPETPHDIMIDRRGFICAAGAGMAMAALATEALWPGANIVRLDSIRTFIDVCPAMS